MRNIARYPRLLLATVTVLSLCVAPQQRLRGAGTVHLSSAPVGATGSSDGAPLARLRHPSSLLSADQDTASGPQNALRFDGIDDYVSLGNAPALGLSKFTLETWFKREGTGNGAILSSRITAVPLIAKGRTDGSDGTNKDFNYFLGIVSASTTPSNVNKLVADFEEGQGGTTPGANHEIVGTTDIQPNVWYHAAATYDGGKWQLFLNGRLERELVVNQPARADSIEYAALGGALNATGTPVTPSGSITSGFFKGQLDEARIWNTARTAQQVKDSFCTQIESAQGLVGRWGLNEAAGTTAYDNSGNDGTLVNGPVWVVPSDAPLVAPTPGNYALDLDGASSYVTLGNTPELGLRTFTLETWFKREGPGSGAITSSRVTAVPLIAKGRTDGSDGTNRDINYFLGILTSSPTYAANVLVADFEEGAEGSGPGSNHEVVGVTPIANDVWYHAAATYDGAKWQLFLNGNLEAEQQVNEPPRSDSIEHAALGSALNSVGTPVTPATATTSGFFAGVLDEARIWNFARTQQQIIQTRDVEVQAASGLVARWSLNEGCCVLVTDSATSPTNGTVVGANYHWVGDGFANGTTAAPISAPSGNQEPIVDAGADQTITLPANALLRGTVTDDGFTGPLTVTWSEIRGPGTATFSPATAASTTASFSGPGVYLLRLTATDNDLVSSDDVFVTVGAAAGSTSSAIDFGTVKAYVDAGGAPKLGLKQFTIETWFNQQGPGAGVSTGGFAAIVPLVTKGRGESDGSNTDVNYVLGINEGFLAADFEVGCTDAQGAGCTGVSPLGENKSLTGISPLFTGRWYHAAATYDGRVLRLYLNGLLESERQVAAAGQPVVNPRWDSIAPVGLASALNSSGAAQGHFNGVMDEVRIWDHALSELEIQANLNTQVTTGAGLVARWGLNEGVGTAVADSVAGGAAGTVRGQFYSWAANAPFNIVPNHAPGTPALISPANDATGVSTSPTLSVRASDSDGGNVTVTFYGRTNTSNAPDFTLVALPDTQFYVSSLNGGLPAMFYAQTRWIVDNKASRNIAFVTQLGDCVQNGDNGGNPFEWDIANTAMSELENPVTTELPEGLPYGVAVGNHDETPNGDPKGTTTFFNQYFGESRFLGRSYYGGHYGTTNDNHFELFSASGMDFIVVHLKYEPGGNPLVLAWARSILQSYSNRRAIVVSHYIIGTGNPGAFGTQGQKLYDTIKSLPNVFLMLSAHIAEGQRQDTFNNHTVYSLMSDYQSWPNGGNGLLRIMTFSPSTSRIKVETYSPYTSTYERDADSEFSLFYDMADTNFTPLGTVTVAAGATASVQWSGLAPGTNQEWYATVSDGEKATKGPVWRFTTASSVP